MLINLVIQILKYSNTQILDLLKIKYSQKVFVLAELIKNDEVYPFTLPENGFMINPTIGLLAYSEKKYLNKNWNIILQWTKNFVQLFIPLISLLIAYLSITYKIEESKNHNLIKNKQLIDLIDQQNYKLEILEMKIKDLHQNENK